MQGPPRPAPALAAEPGYGPGLTLSDWPGHYTGLAASDMNKLYAATIGPDSMMGSKPGKTRRRGPNQRGSGRRRGQT